MKVVTIMNYPDKTNENVMCSIWIEQVRKNFPESINVEILTCQKLPPDVQKTADVNNVVVSVLDPTNEIDFSRHPDGKKAQHNVCFKLYNLCKIDEPFIFIDADAFLLVNAEPMLLASKEKGFIAVNHQVIPGQTSHLKEPVLNSGVMIVSDPTLFDWRTFINILVRDQRFVHPGTDQSLINSRFKEANFDYVHPSIGYSWNSWAAYTVWENGVAMCKGLPEEHPVSINHYWNHAKPWNIACPIYKGYLKRNNEP